MCSNRFKIKLNNAVDRIYIILKILSFQAARYVGIMKSRYP